MRPIPLHISVQPSSISAIAAVVVVVVAVVVEQFKSPTTTTAAATHYMLHTPKLQQQLHMITIHSLTITIGHTHQDLLHCHELYPIVQHKQMKMKAKSHKDSTVNQMQNSSSAATAMGDCE